jgi:hypothetical protein
LKGIGFELIESRGREFGPKECLTDRNGSRIFARNNSQDGVEEILMGEGDIELKLNKRVKLLRRKCRSTPEGSLLYYFLGYFK